VNTASGTTFALADFKVESFVVRYRWVRTSWTSFVRIRVEVDGGQHAERVKHDAARSEWLVAQGYRVLRFWNNDVLENIEGVLETLLAELAMHR
jgi:very-short-patch-repair endonuclease